MVSLPFANSTAYPPDHRSSATRFVFNQILDPLQLGEAYAVSDS